jgi:hypothetical protein
VQFSLPLDGRKAPSTSRKDIFSSFWFLFARRGYSRKLELAIVSDGKATETIPAACGAQFHEKYVT